MIIKVPLWSSVAVTVFVIGLFGEPVERREERTRDSCALNGDGGEEASSGLTVIGRGRENRRETGAEIDVELELNK